MLRFELFDETGKLHPRKVLFSAETSPERANSVLTKLFGGLMKWNARRWAENYLTGFQRKSGHQHTALQGKAKQLLSDIRKTGSVQTTPFFTMAAQIIQAEKSATGTEKVQAHANKKGGMLSAPHIINSDEIVRRYQPAQTDTTARETGKERITSDETPNTGPAISAPPRTDKLHNASGDADIAAKTDESSAATGTTTLSDNALPKPAPAPERTAHEVILEQWEKSAKIREGMYADPLYREAFRSGFIKYCAGGLQNPSLAELDALVKFISHYQHQWHLYENLLTPTQYAQWTSKAHAAIKDVAEAREKIHSAQTRALFHGKDSLSGNDLADISWEPHDISHRLQREDLEKIHDYFNSAEKDEFNQNLAKSMMQFAKKATDDMVFGSDVTNERRDFLLKALEFLQELSITSMKKAPPPSKPHQLGDSPSKNISTTKTAPILEEDAGHSPAHEAIFSKWLRWNTTPAMQYRPRNALGAMVTSGFVEYCKQGYNLLTSITQSEFEKLEAIANGNEDAWQDLSVYLDVSELGEIRGKRQQLILDITKSKNTPSDQIKREQIALERALNGSDDDETTSELFNAEPYESHPQPTDATSVRRNSNAEFYRSMRDQVNDVSKFLDSRLPKSNITSSDPQAGKNQQDNH